jgi:hypothetical protein
MTENLTEEEMRLALFGPAPTPTPAPAPAQEEKPAPAVESAPAPATAKPASAKPRPISKALSPKLRVILHVTKEYEGAVEVFSYDANTLSSFVAEQEAKAEAKKKKFKYFELVSVSPI